MRFFETIEKKNIVSRTMRHEIIGIIYKEGDKQQLNNWRPISLLNVDYKILARVMAKQLKHVLLYYIYFINIISASQTCSLLAETRVKDTLSTWRGTVIEKDI